jgi:hypothetical protein
MMSAGVGTIIIETAVMAAGAAMTAVLMGHKRPLALHSSLAGTAMSVVLVTSIGAIAAYRQRYCAFGQ